MSERFIFGNWKMAQSLAKGQEFLAGWKFQAESVRVGLFLSYPHIKPLMDIAPKTLEFGAQDFSDEQSGAYTSEVSAEMLSEIGCRWSLLGHSEVRQRHGESEERLSKKLDLAEKHKIQVVFCVGENLEAREAGQLEEVLERQLSVLKAFSGDCLIAYEPVWAIGTGRTASTAEIEEAHNLIRQEIPGVALLYGGSVKPGNSKEILSLEAVDGLLVGGASLSLKDFVSICESALESS